MNDKVLSVVVPAYNVGRVLLERNVRSLVASDDGGVLDVIVIDDGSTDDTGEAADGLSSSYPSSVRVFHKENGGYGSGVNLGIANATGKYLCVVDADDYVDSDAFRDLLPFLGASDCDLVLGNYATVDASGNILQKCRQSKNLSANVEYKFEDVAAFLDPFTSASVGVHTEFIKTRLLRDSHTVLHERHFYTDREYSMYPLPLIHTVIYYDACLRYYYLGREGQSADRKTQIRHYGQAVDVTGYLRDFYVSNKEFFQAHPNTEFFYLRIASHHDRMCYAMQLSNPCPADGKREMVKHDQWVEQTWPELYRINTYLPIELLRKTGFAIYPIARWLYHIVLMR